MSNTRTDSLDSYEDLYEKAQCRKQEFLNCTNVQALAAISEPQGGGNANRQRRPRSRSRIRANTNQQNRQQARGRGRNCSHSAQRRAHFADNPIAQVNGEPSNAPPNPPAEEEDGYRQFTSYMNQWIVSRGRWGNAPRGRNYQHRGGRGAHGRGQGRRSQHF